MTNTNTKILTDIFAEIINKTIKKLSLAKFSSFLVLVPHSHSLVPQFPSSPVSLFLSFWLPVSGLHFKKKICFVLFCSCFVLLIFDENQCRICFGWSLKIWILSWKKVMSKEGGQVARWLVFQSGNRSS